MRLYNLTDEEVRLVRDFRAMAQQHQAMVAGIATKLAEAVAVIPAMVPSTFKLVHSK